MPPRIKLKPLPPAIHARTIEHAQKLATNGNPALIVDANGVYEKLVVLPVGLYEEHLRIIRAAEFFDRMPPSSQVGFLSNKLTIYDRKSMADLLEDLAQTREEIAKMIAKRNVPIVGRRKAPFAGKRSIPKQK